MQPESPAVLVIDDEPRIRRALERQLQQQGYRVLLAATGEEGLELARRERPEVALVDLDLPDVHGLEVIGRLAAEGRVACVAFTGVGDAEAASEAIERGAWDYFQKPVTDSRRFFQVLRTAVERQRLRRRLEVAEAEFDRRVGSELIGNSPAMVQLRQRIADIAASSASCLITGPSGAGKEVVARAIHRASQVADGPFVAINCSAFSADRLEAELFGWERGSFTGAVASHPGVFGLAHGGTLFLDEIGDMPLALQAKLLRVIETGEVLRLGATRVAHVRCRFLCATHKDIWKLAEEGAFRHDLLYRLNVFELRVPPLNDRREDIPLLVWHFVHRHAREQHKTVRHIDPEVMELLQQHDWSGNNVRDLRNVLERAVVLLKGDRLTLRQIQLSPAGHQELPAEVPLDPRPRAFPEDLLALPLAEARRRVNVAFTRWYMARALDEAGGVRAEAARRSGCQRSNFSRDLGRYGVDPERDREQGPHLWEDRDPPRRGG